MARITITYRDPSRRPDELSLGAFAQIAAKRRFGIDAMKTDDPEPVYFAAFVELEGPAAAKAEDAFDEWLLSVETLDIEAPEQEDEDPSNPPPAESSGTSPESPPTSD